MKITLKLDQDQQLVLSYVLNYSRQLKIARSTLPPPPPPPPPLLIVQGGAGSGKSMLINSISQWFEKDLRQAGDDPEKPYVLITAFTGTAAANVNGMTLSSAFNFNFGNEFLSLGDKTRDEKREQLKNLKMVIRLPQNFLEIIWNKSIAHIFFECTARACIDCFSFIFYPRLF